MALDYDMLMGLLPRETRQTYSRRDTILYALGVGAASEDPLDRAELRHVYEENLEALPMMAVILGYPGFWQREPQYGLDWKRIVHGEQSIQIHTPIPPEGEVVSLLTIDAIFDKGADKGALLYARREVHDGHGVHLATILQGSFMRGDGGFGGSAAGAPVPQPIPDRDADDQIVLRTRLDQALLYRLNGDFNPLHVDPDIAATAGFPRPILHGLCTYGVVGRALIKARGEAAGRLMRMDARFSNPVFPGDTIRTDIWMLTPGSCAFRAVVPERNAIVINNGFARFG